MRKAFQWHGVMIFCFIVHWESIKLEMWVWMVHGVYSTSLSIYHQCIPQSPWEPFKHNVRLPSERFIVTTTPNYITINPELKKQQCTLAVSNEMHIKTCKIALTHWGRDKVEAMSQTTYPNAFFLNKNALISLKISLKFVPRVRINNIPALFQIMAWRRPGDKPLSEQMMVSLLMHICVTRPQWVKAKARS